MKQILPVAILRYILSDIHTPFSNYYETFTSTILGHRTCIYE
jgi:hypothetical protein